MFDLLLIVIAFLLGGIIPNDWFYEVVGKVSPSTSNRIKKAEDKLQAKVDQAERDRAAADTAKKVAAKRTATRKRT